MHQKRILTTAAVSACAMLTLGSSIQAAPLSYQTAVLADNPYVYHRLGEAPPVTTGTAADDATAANRDGVYQGAPAAGQPGAGLGSDTAVSFDGTGTGATGSYLGNTNIRPFGSSISNSSYEFLFKTNPNFSTATKTSLFGVFNPSATATDVEVTFNSQGNDALATTANTTRFYVKGSDGDAVGVHFTNPALYDGSYHHLVFTFDASQSGASAFAAYVDGVAQALTLQQVGTGAVDADTDPDSFIDFQFDPTFAARNVRGALGATTVQRLANITIDEAALFTTTLTAEQVAAHAAASGVPEPSALALAGVAAMGLLRRRRHA